MSSDMILKQQHVHQVNTLAMLSALDLKYQLSKIQNILLWQKCYSLFVLNQLGW